VAFEIGHLCDEKKMDYIAAPDWQAGFAIAHVVNDWPHIQLIQINDYTCVVDGKVFTELMSKHSLPELPEAPASWRKYTKGMSSR
jgi:hypothetical protein